MEMENEARKPEPVIAASAATKDDSNSGKSKCKSRGKKRKRSSSCSSSDHDTFPENILEVERNLQEAAIRNNLDKESVKKILKKVVCNDHVLALVKLQEEEEGSDNAEDKSLQPKLTRAKAKELMKVSTKQAPWNIELTPIKHIPVKTRPEVKALIAQELPEDEDDEEYKPTQDEVLSDDDHTIESCSDLDSQPRTPATPNSQCTPSPKLIQDGPFKVPQTASSVARRKLNLAEEPTIALRTRSKLSLSTTSIEHIESSFIPPDDLPIPVVDEVWNQFLVECLNPGPSTKNEDDDETDPEYSVAADPDANDEDEEALESSIIKISKKELNDLMTELFDIIPESTADKIAESLVSDGILQNSTKEITWEGKQEPISDDETQGKKTPRITFEKDNTIRYSIGKTEVQNYSANDNNVTDTAVNSVRKNLGKTLLSSTPKDVEMTVCQQQICKISKPEAPEVLKQRDSNKTVLDINVSVNVQILPEQVQILQQQLRQHIQLAATNFLQLYVNPVHWALAPQYKEYLETFCKMHKANPHSIVNVSNMTAAWELVVSWEKSVAEDTPENKAMVEFIQAEADRCRRRAANNSLYVGDFHETFLKTLANSVVVLYPYLLPAMPYRPENPRKAVFLSSEDSLIALGLDQFWEYVDKNPELFQLKRHPRIRIGVTVTLELITKHMMPWISTRKLMNHINRVKKTGGPDNPINKWLSKRIVEPVKHKIIPISPNMTLYEQPEEELPKIWLRYLAKSSKRFKKYINRRPHSGTPAQGVPITIGETITVPNKTPLPIEFTKPILCNRINLHPKKPIENLTNRIDVNITPTPVTEPQVFTVVQTTNGSILVPLNQSVTTDSNKSPITTPVEIPIKPKLTKPIIYAEHCPCCVFLRKSFKRQTKITDFIAKTKTCPCKDRKQERMTKRLKILIRSYKKYTKLILGEIESKIDKLNQSCFHRTVDEEIEDDPKDLEFVSTFQQRLMIKMVTTRDTFIKKKFLSCLDRFDLHRGDVIELANTVENIFDVELVDMFKEFISFLTAEQASKINRYKDYFVHYCIKELIKKVEENITSKKKQEEILIYLKKFIHNKVTFTNECDVCVQLLNMVRESPNLAEYIFSLFPHNRIIKEQKVNNESCKASEDKQTDKEPEQNEAESLCEQSTTMADYEADHSSSGEEEIEPFTMPIKQENVVENEHDNIIVKMEVVSPRREETKETNNSNNKESNKDISMEIIIEENTIKTEPLEWKREEDKLILEILKEHVQERDTRSDVLEDKTIVNLICEQLPHKTIEDVKERMVLILQMLVFSGNK